MKWTGLALALVACTLAPAMAQMHPVGPAHPVTVPDIAPVLAAACLPLANGQPVASGIIAARKLGFTVTATHNALATLEREGLVLNLSPGSCVLTLTPATTAAFPHMDHELSGWLPALGRFWAGGIEADAAGLNARKFRAGGHTVLLWEQVDEDDRQINAEIDK